MIVREASLVPVATDDLRFPDEFTRFDRITYRRLFEVADRCDAPIEDTDRTYVGWGNEAFLSPGGWIVVIFYDGYSIDYIDRIYRPDGKCFSDFWDGRGHGPEWRGRGTLEVLGEFDLDAEIPEEAWRQGEPWEECAVSLTYPIERTA